MKRILSSGIISIVFFSFVTVALAQDGNVSTIDLSTVQGNFGVKATTPLQNILANTFTIVFVVAALLALGFLIFGAIKWITSGGEKEGTKAARQYITAALVGLAVLALSFVIIRIVGLIVGIDIFRSFNIPSLSTTPPVPQ